MPPKSSAALQEIPAEPGGIGLRALRREADRRLPGRSLTAGDVEIRAELATLLVVALAEEREPVRLEEVAEVGLRQQPGVRRVPCALEAVDGERLERVGGSDLVDDENAASRPGHPRQLGDHELGTGDVVERPDGRGEVERLRRERQRRRVRLHELDIPESGGPFACMREQLGDPVDPDALSHERREREGERAGARTDVQRTLVAARLNEHAHLLGKLGRTGVLQRRDPVRGACEPIRHR